MEESSIVCKQTFFFSSLEFMICDLVLQEPTNESVIQRSISEPKMVLEMKKVLLNLKNNRGSLKSACDVFSRLYLPSRGMKAFRNMFRHRSALCEAVYMSNTSAQSNTHTIMSCFCLSMSVQIVCGISLIFRITINQSLVVCWL